VPELNGTSKTPIPSAPNEFGPICFVPDFYTPISSSTKAQADEEPMSGTTPKIHRNRHERRAAEAGHEQPRPERKIDRDGLDRCLAFPMSEVQERLGISRSKAYEEIAAGRLRAVKCGSRTLIPYAAGEAWLDGLPALAA
jgi:excisionase family DNA binding protein